MSSTLYPRPKTRRIRRKPRALPSGPSAIAQMPLGVFRIPPCRWILSLRRMDGEREIRKVSGNLLTAREHRDSLMKTGRYAMAWLMEARDDLATNAKKNTRHAAREPDKT